MENLQQRTGRMNSKTSNLVSEMQRKLISKVTNNPEFKNKDEVIDAAVLNYYNQLKGNRLL
jgi:hypothetical protein